MALGPKEMGEAIIRNLKDKTSRDLDQWIEVVRQSPLTKKRAVMRMLKERHGLGHFQAQKVYERASGTDPYAQ